MGKRLETNRLILREWQQSDHKPFAILNQDLEVMKYFPKVLSEQESNEFAVRSNKLLLEQNFGLWAVEVKDSNEFIGFIGLAVTRFEAHFTPCTEIGWRLKKSAWGNGYATEGARRALEYAFLQFKFNEVVSFTSVLNNRSRNVMQRIGMVTNPSEDFDHPRIDPHHWLCRHVLYRLKSSLYTKHINYNL